MATHNSIRRDIFSVKAWDSSLGDYYHEAMFKNKVKAIREARLLRIQRHNAGESDDVKIVHPSQWVVDGFTAYGNKIIS